MTLDSDVPPSPSGKLGLLDHHPSLMYAALYNYSIPILFRDFDLKMMENIPEMVTVHIRGSYNDNFSVDCSINEKFFQAMELNPSVQNNRWWSLDRHVREYGQVLYMSSFFSFFLVFLIRSNVRLSLSLIQHHLSISKQKAVKNRNGFLIPLLLIPSLSFSGVLLLPLHNWTWKSRV